MWHTGKVKRQCLGQCFVRVLVCWFFFKKKGVVFFPSHFKKLSGGIRILEKLFSSKIKYPNAKAFIFLLTHQSLHSSYSHYARKFAVTFLDFLLILLKFLFRFLLNFGGVNPSVFLIFLYRKGSLKPRKKSPCCYNHYSSWTMFHHFCSPCHHSLFLVIFLYLECC